MGLYSVHNRDLGINGITTDPQPLFWLEDLVVVESEQVVSGESVRAIGT